MVKSPVGPPGVPPVPTVGAWLAGSLPGLSVWAVTADNRIKVVSAAKSALLASLIAFLLRNEFNFCGRGRPCSPLTLRPGGALGSCRLRREKARGAGAPTTSVNPLSQRNCYRPRTRTSCRWSGAARGAGTPVQASVGALALASDSASQLSVTLLLCIGRLCLYKTGTPLSTSYVLSLQHPPSQTLSTPKGTGAGNVPSSARPYST